MSSMLSMLWLVLNHVNAQIIGLEAQKQLEKLDAKPDIIVGVQVVEATLVESLHF